MANFQPVQFGKYLLLDKIGVGGMAELYRAKITGVQGFEKLIAIKKILPHLSSEEVLIKSFIDEAKLAAFLQHQNIVQIYDFGSMEGSYFIAMEYLFGKDLRSVTNKSKSKGMPISLENALHIASRICAGLEYAHNLKDFQERPLNIIHRDIGPQNIFVTYDGQVKIIDFGIAKAAIQESTTQFGSIKGKVAYMSPEQAEGKNIDSRSDIFSIGIILYEMVTHRRMFEGNTYQVFSMVREARFDPPEEVNKDLPPKLYDILHKALAKDFQQRYLSAGEMLSDLDECKYQLSFRSGARNLSQYMETIFEDETGAERIAIQEAAKKESPHLPDNNGEDTGPNEKDAQTVIVSRDELSGKAKLRRVVYGMIAAGLFIIGAVSTFLFMTDPAEILGNRTQILLKYPFVRMVIEKAGIDIQPPDRLKAGMEMLEAKRFEAAAAFFEAKLSEDPSIEESVAVPLSQAIYGIASACFDTDRNRAGLLLQRAVTLDSGNPDGHLLLGRYYTHEKAYQKAIASYENAVNIKPDIPKAYFNLGFIYAAVKDFKKAEQMYQRVVEMSPDFLDEAFFNLAMVQKKLGKTNDSIDNLQQAVAANPDNRSAKKYLERMKKKSGKQP